jgi:hypothetical protein
MIVLRCLCLSLVLLLGSAFSASAAPNPADRFGAAIDPETYDYAKGCVAGARPGANALIGWLKSTGSRGGSWGIQNCRKIPVRAELIEEYKACLRRKAAEKDADAAAAIQCVKPRQNWSLHAEGRALEWRLDAARPLERREAERLIHLLLATDKYGNAHALARRMGIQELIFNCRAWFASSPALQPYKACYGKDGKRIPVSRAILDSTAQGQPSKPVFGKAANHILGGWLGFQLLINSGMILAA